MKTYLPLWLSLFSVSGASIAQSTVAEAPAASAAQQPAQQAAKTPPDSERARVFITDSQSWSIAAQSGGAGGTFGGTMAGGARPQTAEIIKTFGERCSPSDH